MPCSAVTLSLGTIAAVISVSLLAISFSTDNWIRYDIKNRSKLKDTLEQDGINLESKNAELIYYTRTKGLFRICFPTMGERPSIKLYLSPVETYCTNIDYLITDENNVQETFTNDETSKLHMSRGMISLFILSFLFMFISFWTGIIGCWRRSSGNITSTSILILLACLFSAGGMGLFHGIEYYENEKLTTGGNDYYKDWPQPLKNATSISYDWSYIIAWISVGLSLTSAVLFSISAICLSRQSNHNYNQQQLHYIMPVYPSKGNQQAPGGGYNAGGHYINGIPYNYTAQPMNQGYSYNY